jgi:hypothetical protein
MSFRDLLLKRLKEADDRGDRHAIKQLTAMLDIFDELEKEEHEAVSDE